MEVDCLFICVHCSKGCSSYEDLKEHSKEHDTGFDVKVESGIDNSSFVETDQNNNYEPHVNEVKTFATEKRDRVGKDSNLKRTLVANINRGKTFFYYINKFLNPNLLDPQVGCPML